MCLVLNNLTQFCFSHFQVKTHVPFALWDVKLKQLSKGSPIPPRPEPLPIENKLLEQTFNTTAIDVQNSKSVTLT